MLSFSICQALCPFCIHVSKRPQKCTLTDTKVTFHPPTMKIVLVSYERYNQNKTFNSTAMALILPKLNNIVHFVCLSFLFCLAVVSLSLSFLSFCIFFVCCVCLSYCLFIFSVWLSYCLFICCVCLSFVPVCLFWMSIFSVCLSLKNEKEIFVHSYELSLTLKNVLFEMTPFKSVIFF